MKRSLKNHGLLPGMVIQDNQYRRIFGEAKLLHANASAKEIETGRSNWRIKRGEKEMGRNFRKRDRF